MSKFLIFSISIFCICWNVKSQLVPSSYENIDHLMTFSKESSKSWGDDDFVQIYFFSVPKEHVGNLYIRVFDPNCSGLMDQANGSFNSKTKFSVYGGKEAFNHPSARKVDPVRGYDSGVLLDSKVFGSEEKYEQEWFTFGPFNPKEGDLDGDKYVFKMIIEGQEGNDGNGYRLAFSSEEFKNKDVEAGLAFAYEISFRLKSDVKEVAHFYPFIDPEIVSVKQNNFDFDFNGEMRVTSVVKNMQKVSTSNDGEWVSSVLPIVKDEHNLSLDLQIIKKDDSPNDMVLYLQNQYGDAIPFYSMPQPNVPKYKYKVKIKIE